MKHKNILIAASSVGLTLAAGGALAQEDADKMSFSPVETYTCNYNEGKGPDDLSKAIDAWNKYADNADLNNYFAAILTPQFFGDETFDVGWLGSSGTGEEMGAGLDDWIRNGGKAADAFNAAITCNSHSMFASTRLKAPPEGGPPENVVLTFSDCSVKDGKTWEEAFAGIGALVEYQQANGYTHGSWAMFPVYGVSDLDYDFKIVDSFADHAGAGLAFDKIAGGDWEKQEELIGDLLSCDIARVYDAKVVRNSDGE